LTVKRRERELTWLQGSDGMLPYWPHALLFMGAILFAALYGLAASGHFPAEHRAQTLRPVAGAAILWASLAVALLAVMAATIRAVATLPWHAAVIGGGAVLLFAPLILRPLPDRFVNGRSALLILSVGAAGLAWAMWTLA
jgi:hypothetical protein